MATGFGRTENLGESNTGKLDRGILDNLGGPGITDDILLFDGNSKFVSRLVFNQDATVIPSDFLDGVQYRITDLGIEAPGGETEIAAAQLVWNTAAGTTSHTYTLYETFTKAPNVVVTGSGTAIGQLANDFTVGDVASEYEITVGTEGKVTFSNGTKLSMSGTLPLGTGEGFIDFADAEVGKLGVRDMWDGQQATLPSSSLTKVGTITHSSNGFVASNTGTNQIKYLKATVEGMHSVSPIAENGYTLQYEIQNEIFATDYVEPNPPSGSNQSTLAYFFTGAPNAEQWQIGTTTGTKAKWRINKLLGLMTPTVETANLAPINISHSTITISVQGSAGPNPYTISVYKDKTLILETRSTDELQTTLGVASAGDLYIGGVSDLDSGIGFRYPANPTKAIKNVMYIDHATIPRRNIRIAVLGDSNIAGGQYQADTSEMPNPMPDGALRQGGMHSYKSGDPLFDSATPYGAAPHPEHNPPLHGIRQDSRYKLGYLPSTGNLSNGNIEYFFYREESLFARMEYYLANKGLYPTAFAPNQLGIYSAGLSGAFTTNINDQIDAMLGAALDGTGPGSIGINRSLDVVVVNLGTKDAEVFGSADNTALAATAKNDLQNGIDRIISIFNPKAIVVNTVAMPLLINGSATGIPNTNQQAAAADISDKIVELDGYKDVVAVVNLTAALDTSGRQTGFADALHYNPKGYDIMADAIVDKLHFIFATELSESSSFVYDVTDSNGKDKFKVKYDGVAVNVTGTLRRNDAVTKTNMEFLNVKRLSTSGGATQELSTGEDEAAGSDTPSAYSRFPFSAQRDFIEENLSTFTYKSKRVPFTKVDSVFDDNISFAGNLRIIDTAQTGTVSGTSPGIFVIDPTVPGQAAVRAFTQSENDWAKVSGDTAISNVVIKLIGKFEVGTVYEISDLGAPDTTNADWTAVNNNVSKTYAVGDIFKATAEGTAGAGIAKELGVEKSITQLINLSKYTISDLGIASPGGSTQIDAAQAIWNTAAGTTSVVYVVGSTFTATTAGAAISSGDGKAALIEPSKSAKVNRLTIADATDRNVVIETFENTQLVEGLTSSQAVSTFTHKLPVIINGDTYYIMLQKEGS